MLAALSESAHSVQMFDSTVARRYCLVAAFDFRRQIVFVKFVGTHAEYDRIDAMTVSQF